MQKNELAVLALLPKIKFHNKKMKTAKLKYNQRA